MSTTTAPSEVMRAPVGVGRAAQRVAASNVAAEQFFATYGDALARTCRVMAQQFQQHGRLLVCTGDHEQSDVAHVVVEFLHPVVVGKRALPAIPLGSIAHGNASRMLRTCGKPHDILLVLSTTGLPEGALALFARAKSNNIVSIALTGSECGESSADHHFMVPSSDPCIVQETQEMVYHVLWELVHVFFDHHGAEHGTAQSTAAGDTQ